MRVYNFIVSSETLSEHELVTRIRAALSEHGILISSRLDLSLSGATELLEVRILDMLAVEGELRSRDVAQTLAGNATAKEVRGAIRRLRRRGLITAHGHGLIGSAKPNQLPKQGSEQLVAPGKLPSVEKFVLELLRREGPLSQLTIRERCPASASETAKGIRRLLRHRRIERDGWGVVRAAGDPKEVN